MGGIRVIRHSGRATVHRRRPRRGRGLLDDADRLLERRAAPRRPAGRRGGPGPRRREPVTATDTVTLPDLPPLRGARAPSPPYARTSRPAARAGGPAPGGGVVVAKGSEALADEGAAARRRAEARLPRRRSPPARAMSSWRSEPGEGRARVVHRPHHAAAGSRITGPDRGRASSTGPGPSSRRCGPAARCRRASYATGPTGRSAD